MHSSQEVNNRLCSEIAYHYAKLSKHTNGAWIKQNLEIVHASYIHLCYLQTQSDLAHVTQERNTSGEDEARRRKK